MKDQLNLRCATWVQPVPTFVLEIQPSSKVLGTMPEITEFQGGGERKYPPSRVVLIVIPRRCNSSRLMGKSYSNHAVESTVLAPSNVTVGVLDFEDWIKEDIQHDGLELLSCKSARNDVRRRSV